MLLFTLIVALSLALVPLSTATPLVTTLSAPSSNASSSGTSSSSTPPDGPQAKRRGVAYNRPEYVHLFDVQESGVQWCYNWDSLTNPTNTPFEYVAMLWSNGDDVTSKWDESVRRSALAQPNDPTHLLGFNEPDNCQ